MEKTINELQMKYIIILGDGMADEPIGSLGGRTPLQAACKTSVARNYNEQTVLYLSVSCIYGA